MDTLTYESSSESSEGDERVVQGNRVEQRPAAAAHERGKTGDSRCTVTVRSIGRKRRRVTTAELQQAILASVVQKGSDGYAEGQSTSPAVVPPVARLTPTGQMPLSSTTACSPHSVKVQPVLAGPFVDYQNRPISDAVPGSVKQRARHGTGRSSLPPPSPVHTLPLHRGTVVSACVSPSYGHIAATGGTDGKVHVLSLYQDELGYSSPVLLSLLPPATSTPQPSVSPSPIRAVRLSPSPSLLYTGHHTGLVTLFDLNTGQALDHRRAGTAGGSGSSGHASHHARALHTLTPHPTHVSLFLVGLGDGSIVGFDARAPGEAQRYESHGQSVHTVTFVGGARGGASLGHFVSTGADKRILLWEFGLPTVLRRVEETSIQTVTAATASLDGSMWYGQCQDNTVLLYDTRTTASSATPKFRKQRQRFQGHQVTGVKPDIAAVAGNQLIVGGSGGGELFYWQRKSGTMARRTRAHTGTVTALAASPVD
eukprot:CAMPEP_0170750190 /NCGR_PEP_ID=MMETSP0437-20130122/10794_1 /TAXON_ID=0 /ORGANISM="Sexangularia sp." /LENGTH=481 /DNA_ID=CAMNT_0011089159 /DNA_START=10 /DNA_END=1452 /DNA_ORIENTATION=+